MEKSFPVRLLIRNSKLNNLVQSLFAVSIICLAIFYFSMLPSKYSPTELKVFWFIEGVPSWIKQVTLYGMIILTLGFLIDKINTKSPYGELVISDKNILIILSKKTIRIDYEKVNEIMVSLNPLFFNKNDSESLTMFIRTKDGKVTRLKLRHYLLADDLMETLNVVESKGIKISTSYGYPYWAD